MGGSDTNAISKSKSDEVQGWTMFFAHETQKPTLVRRAAKDGFEPETAVLRASEVPQLGRIHQLVDGPEDDSPLLGRQSVQQCLLAVAHDRNDIFIQAGRPESVRSTCRARRSALSRTVRISLRSSNCFKARQIIAGSMPVTELTNGIISSAACQHCLWSPSSSGI